MDNVLVIGSNTTVTRAISQKLTREGARVFLLSDRREKKTFREPGHYYYDYTDDSVREVVDSCRPGTILFMGAYDSAYSWSEDSEQSDYKRYLAGLCNILSCAEDAGVRRFLYLSSECVFEDHYMTQIAEEAPVSPRSVKGRAISMGESIGAYYNRNYSLDVVTARIDHLYYNPESKEECSQVLADLCMQAIQSGTIRVNAKIIRSGIYLNDAVEALFLLCSVPSHQQEIYHITSEEELREDEAASWIKNAASRQVRIEDHTVGVRRYICLKDTYFKNEFDFHIHYHFEERTIQMVQYMQNHMKKYGRQKPEEQVGATRSRRIVRRLFVYLESILCFGVAMLCEQFLGSSSYFEKLDFFLLYVLIFAILQGTYHAIFSATLSMLGYLYIYSGHTLSLQMLMDVGTYVWIAQVFIIGMSVGYLRDRLFMVQQDREEEVTYLSDRLSNMTEIASSTTQIKNYFEQQVINSNESFGSFYDIAARLDVTNDDEVIFVAVQLVAQVMGTKETAMYRVLDNGFCRLMASTTSRAYELGKSIRTSEYLEIFQVLKENNIFINRTIKENYPSMASGMRDEQGNLIIAVFLWDMPYDRMTLKGSNNLRVMSLLIQGAVTRAVRYMEALSEKHYHENTSILEKNAFQEFFEIYKNASQKQLTVFSLLQIHSPFLDVEETDRMLRPLLRNTDLVGYDGGSEYEILLPYSTAGDAKLVENRLKNLSFEVTRIQFFKETEIQEEVP